MEQSSKSQSASKEEGTSLKSFLVAFLIIILVIASPFIIAAVYGAVQSGSLSDWMAEQGAKVEELNFVKKYFGAIESAESAFDFGPKTTTNVSTTGFVLEDFSLVTSSDKVEHGAPLTFEFEYEFANYGDPLEVAFVCYTENNEEFVYGEILPNSVLTLNQGNLKQEIRCQFSEEQTSSLPYENNRQFYGQALFGFETKDVVLDIYLSNPNYLDLLDQGENFFDFHGLDIDWPIRALYNGEPLKIALSPGDEENQPLIVSEDYDSFPVLDLTLTNKWDGAIESLEYFHVYLPEGIILDETYHASPTTMCPFTFVGQVYENLDGYYNKYSVPLDNLEEISFDNTLANEKEISFECWLDIDPYIIPAGESWTHKKIYSDAGYVYESNKEVTNVNYRRIESEII